MKISVSGIVLAVAFLAVAWMAQGCLHADVGNMR